MPQLALLLVLALRPVQLLSGAAAVGGRLIAVTTIGRGL